VASLDRTNLNNIDSYWSGIRGILAIQLAVLFAVSIAAMAYFNWSSNAALTEFTAAGKPSASDHIQQQAKRRTGCARRV
jgi:hypothetical protein